MVEMQAPRAIPRERRGSSDALRRSAKACNRCRKRRTKCAGEPPYPCKGCRDALQKCVYSETEKRVTVPESYLVDLQNQARRATHSRPGREDDSSLTDTPTQYIDLGSSGTNNRASSSSAQYYFMGNSSSTYIANRLNPTTENLDWHAYPHYDETAWSNPPSSLEAPALPPIELAKRLYRAQHAYLGTIFSFLSDKAFYERLEHVYSGKLDLKNKKECLIYCQILLVFAFGQMYSINQWVSHDGPPGFQFFKHALSLVPNAFEDCSIMFVEVLCYVAYFMQAINRRDTAYVYVGIALRMAISLGLHREVSDQEIDSETREHRRRVWWSTYSMERLLCVTSGHPISIQDEDIDLLPPSPMPEENSWAALILTNYTELSRVQGIIGEKIYRKRQKSGPELSACVQHIMKRLSDWYNQLPECMQLNLSESDQPPPRELVSTYLHYYQCINMTARPILLYAIQRQLAANGQYSNGARWEEGFSPEIVQVVDTAISSARSSTLLFNTARKYDLIATYGFIDGEQAFSAALLLVMVNIAFPYNAANTSAMDMALGVLQTMAEKGNKYIQACHSLLTKIKVAAKSRDPVDFGAKDGQTQARDQADDNAATGSTTVVGARCDPPAYFNIDFEGHSGLWAEVLDSIDIDMDRQWVESALFLGDGGEASG